MPDIETIISSYDILNNRRCPFCDNSIDNVFNNDEYIYGYRHFYCSHQNVVLNDGAQHGHIKVMYKSVIDQWELFRVHFFNSNITVDNRNRDGILYISDAGKTYLPYFNVFSYSYQELQDKIKLYLLFS